MKHMTFHVQLLKCLTMRSEKIIFAHGTLGHAIENGQVKGSHMTLNVQHESSYKLH